MTEKQRVAYFQGQEHMHEANNSQPPMADDAGSK